MSGELSEDTILTLKSSRSFSSRIYETDCRCRESSLACFSRQTHIVITERGLSLLPTKS
jgi:hypothetical protein